MKTSITVLILALFVAGVASKNYVELAVKESCCQENGKNRGALMPELITENMNLDKFRLALPSAKDDKDNERLLSDQEEERLVEKFFSGRELQAGCARGCRANPTGYWCLVTCGGSGRRLADDMTVVAGVEASTTTTTLRGHRTQSNRTATIETNVRAAREKEEYVDTSFEALGYATIVMPKFKGPSCLEFPMQIPALIKRLTDNNAKLDNCQLETECLILRKCVDEDTDEV